MKRTLHPQGSQRDDETHELNPATVVQAQLDAYNARDLEALLDSYADDAEMFEHPAKPLAKGVEQLRQRFTARFAEPNLHAKLIHRLVMGTMVVDQELVTRTFPEGPGTLELIMIYEVQHGLISRAWSIVGAKELTAGS